MRALSSLLVATTLFATSALELQALSPKHYPDTILIPTRAVVVSGNTDNAGSLLAVLYDNSDMHFSEPNAPRFLFLDREGKVAFGIGGYLKGTLQYDFNGSIDDGPDFTTYDIPTPYNPAQASQFYGNANHSTLFLQLVGNTSRFGYYQMYIQTNFTGNGAKGYGLKLKQAYLKLGYVTAGLTNSTFVDGAAGTPVIDDQGPAGEMSAKNILVRYAPRFNDHLSAAISVETPSAGYTLGEDQTIEKINQRAPDVPAYVQYQWADGASHIRLSGLARFLSYRDLASGKNRFQTGWAAQLSGIVKATPSLKFYYQGALGRGYAHYINDLADADMDLVETPTPGKMKAPKMANFEIGARYNFNPKLFVSASYSQARLYGVSYLGGDTYRYGQYVSVSGFYNIIDELSVGVEYLHGTRINVNHTSGHANRIEGMIQYTF